jgi:predicted HTH domain antitoxin
MAMVITSPELDGLGMTEQEIKLVLAIQLYSGGRLNLDQASELAELEPDELLRILSKRSTTPHPRP